MKNRGFLWILFILIFVCLTNVFYISQANSNRTGDEQSISKTNDIKDTIQPVDITIPPAIKQQTLEIPGIKGDVNRNGKIRSDDAIMALNIAARLIKPNDYQIWAADMNCDGKVKSDDAILILRTISGSYESGALIGLRCIVPPRSNFNKQVDVTLTDSQGTVGSNVLIPLSINNTHGLAGGDICIIYDNTALKAIDIIPDPNLFLISNITEPGIIRIAFVIRDTPVSNTTAKIKFNVLSYKTSSLKLKEVELYDPNTFPLVTDSVNKEFKFRAVYPGYGTLKQNFPNPFNPETWIPYSLTNPADVTISIHDIRGQLIRTLNLGYHSAGSYLGMNEAAYWDGRNESGEKVTSGVYFYTIRTGGFTDTKKMVVAK